MLATWLVLNSNFYHDGETARETMNYQVLNPTSELSTDHFTVAPRIPDLAGTTVGLISNGKEGTNGFFSHLTQLLYDELQVAKVVLRQKSNYSAPAEAEIIREAGSWDVAITGLGD